MAREKIVPVVHLPHGEVGAFFSNNCFYNLHAILPNIPPHDSGNVLEPVPWPGLSLSFKANVIAGANRMS